GRVLAGARAHVCIRLLVLSLTELPQKLLASLGNRPRGVERDANDDDQEGCEDKADSRQPARRDSIDQARSGDHADQAGDVPAPVLIADHEGLQSRTTTKSMAELLTT